ncbi:MAG: hypothetical protein HY294_04215 [Candidatus Rokubacteria bacterium]|nr:hypothetical protein [Candidatus Rokubacteria bacterium]
MDIDARFRTAAWTYFVYGVLYWSVALYLQLTVLPVRGGLLFWFGVGAAVAVGVPWLLARRRPGFERWVLSRRDFARLLTVLVAARALIVASIAVHGPLSMRMPSMGAGVPASQGGAWIMAAAAAITAGVLARAAWSRDERAGPRA